MDKISLIIPTYKRHFDFNRTLQSVMEQIEAPDEVITVIGPKDNESWSIAVSYNEKIKGLIILEADKGSLVNALNIGLTNCSGDIICLTDDDVWLPNDWIKKIKKFYNFNKNVGAYGGPDKLITVENYKISYPTQVPIVGKFRWYGAVGNHHCGIIKSPASVDILKGVNLSFRRKALKELFIDQFLENRGAEICTEIEICQRIKLAGFRIIYDNNNYVIHYASKRSDEDNRNDVFSPLNHYRTFNMAYCYVKFRPFYEILIYFIREILVGSWEQPGIIRSIFMIKESGIKLLLLPFRKLIPLAKGFVSGANARRLLKNQKSNDVYFFTEVKRNN